MKIIINGKTAETGGGVSPNETDSAKEVYSTEEIPVGTWIDGKTIYRKVFHGTTLTNSMSIWKDLGSISDSETIVHIYGVIKDINDTFFPTTIAEIYMRVSNHVVSINVRHKNYSECPVNVIVEYTKTTDSTD